MSSNHVESRDPIRGARRAPLWCWPVLAVVVGAGTVFLNQVFLPGRSWRPIWDATNGWVHPTLLGGLLVLGLALLVLVAGARIPPRDLGLQASKVPAALLYGVLLWGFVQVFVTGWGVVAGGRPDFHGSWTGPGIPGGSLLGQLLGNALMEEVLYRGFVFAQLVLLLGGKGRVALPRLLLVALLASVIFAVSHVPNRIMKDLYSEPFDVVRDQGMLLLSGTLLALMYWRTRNLPFVVVVHSLTNRPTMAFELPDGFPVPPEAVAFGGGLLATLLWPRLPLTGRGGRG